jgi:hypothetical protein
LLNPDELTVEMRLAEEAEVDALWAYVGRKHEQRWLH